MNLGTDKPSVDMLRESVTKVLVDGRYLERARAIQAEMRNYDPIQVVVDSIEEVSQQRK